MYGWDPEGGFHDAVWRGTLIVDAPCVFLDVSGQEGAVLTPENDPLRGFVRLPEPLTRYDPDTNSVWVGDHGPMSSGDEAVLTGSQGWQLRWSTNEEDGMHDFAFSWEREYGCPAHVSFWAATMSPLVREDVEPLDNPGQTAWLAGLFPWDTDQASTDIGADMVLLLEAPCVFVVPLSVWDAPETRGQITHRYFLRLPRPLVRYDADNNSLWVGAHGPMTTGDEVSLQGGPEKSSYGSEFYEGGCSARGEWLATWMSPRHS